MFDPVTMAWTDLSDAASGVPPTARYNHGFTSVGGKLYVHGGLDAYDDVLGDLHSFDPVAMAWTDLSASVNGTAPTARFRHGFTSAEGKLYVHGGQGAWDGSEYPILGDLHSFDPVAKVWNLSDAASGTPPTARYEHGFTSTGGKLYVHGGSNCLGGCPLGDLHSFDPVAVAWTDLSDAVQGTPPVARWGHGFTCLILQGALGRLYVHGGYGNTGCAHRCAHRCFMLDILPVSVISTRVGQIKTNQKEN